LRQAAVSSSTSQGVGGAAVKWGPRRWHCIHSCSFSVHSCLFWWIFDEFKTNVVAPEKAAFVFLKQH